MESLARHLDSLYLVRGFSRAVAMASLIRSKSTEVYLFLNISIYIYVHIAIVLPFQAGKAVTTNMVSLTLQVKPLCHALTTRCQNLMDAARTSWAFLFPMEYVFKAILLNKCPGNSNNYTRIPTFAKHQSHSNTLICFIARWMWVSQPWPSAATNWTRAMTHVAPTSTAVTPSSAGVCTVSAPTSRRVSDSCQRPKVSRQTGPVPN